MTSLSFPEASPLPALPVRPPSWLIQVDLLTRRVMVESLRSLRQINYAAWLARRWSDPAFPRAFPWFAEPRYWERHVLDLREQLAELAEH